MTVPADQLVTIYLKIRDERDKLLREYEERDNALKADLEQISAEFLKLCDSIGADSIKTAHGTVMRSIKERYTCGDWSNFKQFLIENDAVDCLERRIHQGNFKQFMAEHEQDGLPPGVNVMREYAITVRRASNQ